MILYCRDCESPFTYHSKKPGYRDQCGNCARDIPKLTAEMGEEDGGVVETMTTKEDFYRASRQVFKEEKETIK